MTLPRLTIEQKRAIYHAAHMALCKKDFWDFCNYVDGEFFSKRPFLKEVCDAFTWLTNEYRQGRAKKVAVSLPPRAGKSFCTSLFCVWFLGNFPELSVMRNSCTATLYQKFSYDVRALIRNERCIEVFGGAISMADDKQNLDGWNLRKARQVSYFGNGVGGSIIGFGANLAISDDLYIDMNAARSTTVREKTQVWKESAHNSRMELNCPEIYIGTRWMKTDVIGKAIESGEVDKAIKIAALQGIERDELGQVVKGKSFCENVKSTAEYLKIAQTTDQEIFDAEYQQEPLELKGLLFPPSSLTYFDSTSPLFPSEYEHMPIDPADMGKDYLSAPWIKLYGNCLYITKVMYTQKDTGETLPTLEEWICAPGTKLNFVTIEANGGWMPTAVAFRDKIQKRRPHIEFRCINNFQNKETRILAQAAWIRMYCRFLPPEKQDADYKKFMQHLTEYLRASDGKQQDGAPDSLVIAAHHFKNLFPNLW